MLVPGKYYRCMKHHEVCGVQHHEGTFIRIRGESESDSKWVVNCKEYYSNAFEWDVVLVDILACDGSHVVPNVWYDADEKWDKYWQVLSDEEELICRIGQDNDFW